MDPVPNLALPGSSKVATSMYAIGDCCANPDKPLPPLAQVAEQQGKYLAAVLNAKQKQLEEAPVPEFKRVPTPASAVPPFLPHVLIAAIDSPASAICVLQV